MNEDLKNEFILDLTFAIHGHGERLKIDTSGANPCFYMTYSSSWNMIEESVRTAMGEIALILTSIGIDTSPVEKMHLADISGWGLPSKPMYCFSTSEPLEHIMVLWKMCGRPKLSDLPSK